MEKHSRKLPGFLAELVLCKKLGQTIDGGESAIGKLGRRLLKLRFRLLSVLGVDSLHTIFG